MQQMFLRAIVCGFFVVSLPLAAWAGRADDTELQLQRVSNSVDVLPPTNPRTNPVERRVKKGTEADSKPKSLQDLLFTAKPRTPDQRPLDSMSIEPWMPGRGSLGVKVEVTW
jgi:hypothetical protein